MSNPIIDNVIVASDLSFITVSGSGFKPGSVAPSVAFNGVTLTVTSFSDTSFTATLPGGLSSGSYLLEVENSDAFSIVAVFEVAIVTSTPQADLIAPYNQAGNGFVRNLTLGTSFIQIPAIGIGLSSSGTVFDPPVTGVATIPNFAILIDPGIPSSVGNMNVYMKNVTTNTTIGPAVLIPGTRPNYNEYNGTALAVSAGDQLAFNLNLNSGTMTFPWIEWFFTLG